MTRRTVLLIGAILVAALGTTAVFLYVNGINNRATANQHPIRILVAKRFIPLGTTANSAAGAGAFTVRSYPRDLVSANALLNVTPIAGEVALTAIYPGQQILTDEFGKLGTASALQIPGNELAISVSLEDPSRVAGFVAPGSMVAVFDTVSSNGTSSVASAGTTPLKPQTRLLLSSAEVIGVGPETITPLTTKNTSTGQVNTQQVPLTILTLALTQAQAEKVIFAQANGALYLGLLTPQSKVAPDGGVTAQNLFN